MLYFDSERFGKPESVHLHAGSVCHIQMEHTFQSLSLSYLARWKARRMLVSGAENISSSRPRKRIAYISRFLFRSSRNPTPPSPPAFNAFKLFKEKKSSPIGRNAKFYVLQDIGGKSFNDRSRSRSIWNRRRGVCKNFIKAGRLN